MNVFDVWVVYFRVSFGFVAAMFFSCVCLLVLVSGIGFRFVLVVVS